MTAVTVLLIDSRLQSDRKMRTEVTIKPIKSSDPYCASPTSLFVNLTGQYEHAEPATLDIPDGIWFIEFKSYLGSNVGSHLEVSGSHYRFTFDAARLDGHWAETKTTTHEQIERRTRLGAPFLAREHASNWKLLPSSARATDKLKSRHDATGLQIFLQEYLYTAKENKRSIPKKCFLDLMSFEERFEYWMNGWERYTEATELQTEVTAKKNSELSTSRTCIRFEEGRHKQPRRFVLVLRFTDERYFFVLPGSLETSEAPSTLDVEIDFYASPRRVASGRVVQTRILTNEPRFNGVLQQLSVGSLYDARNLWTEGAEDLLVAKYANPVAAAAGALLLVQPDVLGNKNFMAGRQELKDWFVNLYKDFLWLPEGAICLAWLYGAGIDPYSGQAMQDDAAIKRCVAELLEEAVERGLPYYTEGLKLLRQGSDWANDLVTAETTDSVRWLAMSSVRAGPFLLIRDLCAEGGK